MKVVVTPEVLASMVERHQIRIVERVIRPGGREVVNIMDLRGVPARPKTWGVTYASGAPTDA